MTGRLWSALAAGSGSIDALFQNLHEEPVVGSHLKLSPCVSADGTKKLTVNVSGMNGAWRNETRIRQNVEVLPFAWARASSATARFPCAQEEFADGDILFIGPPLLGIGYRVRIEAPVHPCAVHRLFRMSPSAAWVPTIDDY